MCCGKRHEKIGGGPSVRRSFVAHKTTHVIMKQVSMVQSPKGTGKTDTECRSACVAHDFHVSLQATMESYTKLGHVKEPRMVEIPRETLGLIRPDDIAA